MMETIPKEQINIKSTLPSNLGNFSLGIDNAYEHINGIFNAKSAKEKSIQEARDILGQTVDKLSDSQVLDLVNEVQFLVESWLDEYERDTFDGMNLDELIGLNK